jgi:hypothetical protein
MAASRSWVAIDRPFRFDGFDGDLVQHQSLATSEPQSSILVLVQKARDLFSAGLELRRRDRMTLVHEYALNKSAASVYLRTREHLTRDV